MLLRLSATYNVLVSMHQTDSISRNDPLFLKNCVREKMSRSSISVLNNNVAHRCLESSPRSHPLSCREARLRWAEWCR